MRLYIVFSRFFHQFSNIFAAAAPASAADAMHRAVMAPTKRQSLPAGYKPMARAITHFHY